MARRQFRFPTRATEPASSAQITNPTVKNSREAISAVVPPPPIPPKEAPVSWSQIYINRDAAYEVRADSSAAWEDGWGNCGVFCRGSAKGHYHCLGQDLYRRRTTPLLFTSPRRIKLMRMHCAT